MRHGQRLTAACGVALLLLTIGSALGQVSRVVRIAIVVEDMDRSIDFYTRVLDFKTISDTEAFGEDVERRFGVFGARVRSVQLKLGEQTIELNEFLTPRGKLIPRDSRSNDGWFQHIAIVTTDMDRAYARLREHKVRHASTAPQTLPDWNPNAGGIKAFYFRDPDDHNLEIIYFPPGKGDPKWQQSTQLFAGIDHTAIVVRDTTSALKFYRDTLGMRVAGTSENYGAEQEHLNNVRGAHLRITGLRAAAGPGVEFLEYVEPTDRRPYPPDARANDLFAWRTSLVAADVAVLIRDLESRGYTLVTHNLVRDDDGHFIEILPEKREMESADSK